MKIRFIERIKIRSDGERTIEYNLQYKTLFGWKLYTWQIGIESWEAVHFNTKEELLRRLQDHKNIKKMDITEYPMLKQYTV